LFGPANDPLHPNPFARAKVVKLITFATCDLDTLVAAGPVAKLTGEGTNSVGLTSNAIKRIGTSGLGIKPCASIDVEEPECTLRGRAPPAVHGPRATADTTKLAL
jgi:hypothetical protein